MTYIFDVECLLADGLTWHAVCRCLSAESTTAVVLALLRASNGKPLRVNPLPAPDDFVAPAEQPPF